MMLHSPSPPAPHRQGVAMAIFRVEIRRGTGPDTFHVRGDSPVAGQVSADVRLAAEELLGRRVELQRAVLRSSASIQDDGVEDEQRVQEIGRQLFTALLGSVQLWGLYQASLMAAAHEEERLKVLVQTNDPVLAGLPWEAMYDDSNGSYVSRRTHLIRQLDVPAAAAPLAVKPPLRILGVVSSPVELRKLDVQREKTNLEEVLTSLAHDRKAEVVWAPSTWKDLQHTLSGGQWHAVHYIGHGGFDQKKDRGVLALTDKDGHMHLVAALELVDLLRQARTTPRLVVLNSCSGAASGVDLFSGTAAALIRGGAAAVVAMQYEISDQAAVEFSRGFYDAIANGLGVDAAVSAGRVAIMGWRAGTLEWLSPVLYLRGDDCCLFTMHQALPTDPGAATGAEHVRQHRLRIPPRESPAEPPSQPEPAHVIKTLSGHNGVVSSVAFSPPDGSLLASAGHDETVRLRTTATGAEVHNLPSHARKPGRLAFSPDGRLLAFAGIYGSVSVWEWEVYKIPTLTLRGLSGEVSSVAFSPDGSLLAYADRTTVGIWEIGTGSTRSLVGHADIVKDVAFSRDGLLASAGGYDQTVRLWEVGTDTVAHTLTGHTGMVTRVAFSPDGNLLASAGANIKQEIIRTSGSPHNRQGRRDQTVRLWDVSTRSERFTLTGHTDGVQDVAFSPDGRLLASAALDRTVRLWDVSTGSAVNTLTGHIGGVSSIAFSPDGSLLAAAGSNEPSVRLWADYCNKQAPSVP
jgi:WD40 repeat protein